MGKGIFKEADVTRAFEAAKKAGIAVQVEIDLEHKRLTITPVKAGEFDSDITNPWDEVLTDGKAQQKRSS
jgi:hypothetical protein